MQDLDRAVVIGSRSFGKGLVQRPLNLSYGTQVKVTISRYYTPSGRCIQALDYSRKDLSGKAIKKTQDEFNAFNTKKGRVVYDGGGIQPDVAIAETKISSITDALLKNNAIFDFATQLYYQKPNNTSVSDIDFNAFKAFVKNDKYKLDTETELALETLLEKAKKENIDTAIAAEYQQLLTALQKSEQVMIDKNQKEIKNLILDEIIKRYQYKEGLYQYYTKSNLEIKRAVSLLNNTAEYNKILKI